MPRELSPAEERTLARYEALGTPEELQKLAADNEKLKKENAERREANRALTEERDGLKAKVPDGAVVLTGDEAKAYETLTASGVALTDVPKVAEERDALRTQKAKRDRRDELMQGAPAEGWGEHAADVLLDTVGFDAVTDIELRDVDGPNGRDGKPTKVKAPFLTVDGKQVRASEWVKEHKPHLAGALAVQGSTSGNGTGDSSRAVPEQRGGGGSTPTVRTQEDHTKAVRSRVDYSV